MSISKGKTKESSSQFNTMVRIAILGFTLLFTLNAFSLESHNPQQVTEESVRELKTLLEKHQIKTNHIPTADLEKHYRTRTAAHRMHLSQIFLKVSKDPQFAKDFPEFKPLMTDMEKTVQGLLNHDSAKRDPRTKNAIEVLSKAQGYDFRQPPKGVTPEVHEKISTILKQAIGDINRLDDLSMEEKYKALGRDPNWTQKHKQLTEVLDYYDTYKTRQSEFADKANGGRTLRSPSEWIDKLEKDGKYTSEEMKDNALKKRFAKYLETKDPLKNPRSFSKPEDFSKTKSADFVADIDESFDRKAKALRLQAYGNQILNRFKPVAGTAIKGHGALAAGSFGIQYLISPETTDGGELLEGLAMSLDAGDCSTIKCNNFKQNCLKTLGLKDSSLSHLAKQSGFEKCLNQFLEMPLEDQSTARKDAMLDKIFSNIVPAVHGLRCEKNKIHLITRSNKNTDHQVVHYSDAGKPSRMVRQSEKSQDFVHFEGDPVLQRCQASNCKNYSMSEVKKQKLYVWVAADLPRDSYRWAKHNEKVVRGQSDKLQGCCESSTCQAYFQKRNQQHELRALQVGAK